VACFGCAGESTKMQLQILINLGDPLSLDP
jgi:hypothetical protein